MDPVPALIRMPGPSPNAAANAARQRPGDLPDEPQVVALFHRGVQIDHLYFGKPLEPPHPAKYVLVFNGKVFALNQLHHGAVLKID